MKKTIKNNELFEKIKKILDEHEINLDEYQEIQIQKEKEKEPYAQRLNFQLTSEYNTKYEGEKTCICGHDYHRHFDSWEDNEPTGCKYCRCYEFEPIEDGLNYKYSLRKNHEGKDGFKVFVEIKKGNKIKKEFKFTTNSKAEYGIELEFDDLLKTSPFERKIEVTIEKLDENDSELFKKHFSDIKEYFKKINANISLEGAE